MWSIVLLLPSIDILQVYLFNFTIDLFVPCLNNSPAFRQVPVICCNDLHTFLISSTVSLKYFYLSKSPVKQHDLLLNMSVDKIKHETINMKALTASVSKIKTCYYTSFAHNFLKIRRKKLLESF